VLIEIQDRQKLLVHHDVATSVDNLLRGRAPDTELRYRTSRAMSTEPHPKRPSRAPPRSSQQFLRSRWRRPSADAQADQGLCLRHCTQSLEQAAIRLKLPVIITEDMGEADIVMTVKNLLSPPPEAHLGCRAA